MAYSKLSACLMLHWSLAPWLLRQQWGHGRHLMREFMRFGASPGRLKLPLASDNCSVIAPKLVRIMRTARKFKIPIRYAANLKLWGRYSINCNMLAKFLFVKRTGLQIIRWYLVITATSFQAVISMRNRWPWLRTFLRLRPVKLVRYPSVEVRY